MKHFGKWSFTLLMIALCIHTNAYAKHDIHISFGKAELKGDVFEAKLTIYKDDLLRALTSWHSGGYAGMDATEFRALELRYMTSYFRVWDGKQEQLKLTSSITTEQDASITFDLVYATPSKPSSLVLDSRILFKEYVDQTNVLVLDAFGDEINHVFTRSSPTFTYKP